MSPPFSTFNSMTAYPSADMDSDYSSSSAAHLLRPAVPHPNTPAASFIGAGTSGAPGFALPPIAKSRHVSFMGSSVAFINQNGHNVLPPTHEQQQAADDEWGSRGAAGSAANGGGSAAALGRPGVDADTGSVGWTAHSLDTEALLGPGRAPSDAYGLGPVKEGSGSEDSSSGNASAAANGKSSLAGGGVDADDEDPLEGAHYDPSDEEKAHLRRVIASSVIGNTLEWYDFLVYIYLGKTIQKLFFPPSSVYAHLLAFYGIFAAGFLTRPLGALVFGCVEGGKEGGGGV